MSHHHPDMPQVQARNNATIGDVKFLVPSPVPTRRNRTFSASERAATGPNYKGKIKSFCRQRGHGFITPEDSEEIFVHISDIEGEYVPREGDEVTYKTVAMPPRTDRYQAVHVVITHLAPGVTHERWEAPVSPLSSSPKSPH